MSHEEKRMVETETEKEKKEERVVVNLAGQVIERDSAEPKKKCCTNMSKDARWCLHCCIKTWSCTLNTCECCCTGLSDCCLFCSAVALGSKKFMEEIDCDETH